MSKISKIKVTHDATTKSFYAVSNVTVAITLEDAPFDDGSKDFRCCIFADDYYPMADSKYDALSSWEWPDYLVYMECKHVWLPGTYILIVREEMSLPKKASLTLDKHMRFKVGKLTDCALFDREYTLVDSLLDRSDSWFDMANTPGVGILRHKAVEYKQIWLFNSMLVGMDYPAISTNENMLIYTVDRGLPNDAIRQFHRTMNTNAPITIIDCASLYDITLANPYEPLNDCLLADQPATFCLTNVGALLSTGGKTVIRRILSYIREIDYNRLWICDFRQDIESLTDIIPTLADFFPSENRLQLQPYTAFELVQALYGAIIDCGLQPTAETVDTLARAVLNGYSNGSLAGWSMADVKRYVNDKVRTTYLHRVLADIRLINPPVLIPADIDTETLTGGLSAFEENIRELNEMTGLDAIKQSITTMANRTRFYQMRRKLGLQTTDQAVFHAIFTGNPGTGKTTVARKLGRIYHSLGLLSRGNVIAVDRTRLVGRFIGETEENMKAIFEEARGNVLFIDEAYTLSDGSSDRKDYGARVIDALLTVLTQPNPDMLIIFAGYEKEMDAMLQTNPGLTGRFPYKFHFDDYNAEQLLEIAHRLLQREEYCLTAEAAQALQHAINETYEHRTKNFSNARWVEQFVRNGIIPAMADRINATAAPATADIYKTIEADDVTKAYDHFNHRVVELRPRRQIGFSA